MVEAQIQGAVAEGSPSVSFQQRFGKSRVQLRAENGTRIVGVGADQLSVHMLKPYTGWEDFRPRIRKALEAYRQIAEPEAVARIGLRYINRISFEEPTPDLSHYFTIPPRFPDVDPATRMLAFFNRKEVEYLDKPIRAVVTFADVEAPAVDQSTYLLDIDLIWIASEAPIPLDSLPEIMEEIKVRHRQVFESLITDASRSLFNGD